MIPILLSPIEWRIFFVFPCAFWRHPCRHYPLRPLRGTNAPRKILPFRRLLDGLFFRHLPAVLFLCCLLVEVSCAHDFHERVSPAWSNSRATSPRRITFPTRSESSASILFHSVYAPHIYVRHIFFPIFPLQNLHIPFFCCTFAQNLQSKTTVERQSNDSQTTVIHRNKDLFVRYLILKCPRIYVPSNHLFRNRHPPRQDRRSQPWLFLPI